MTTDQYTELIEFLAGKFQVIDERFRGIDQRFDGIDQRFDGIDQRFDGIDQRFDGIDQQLDEARRHAVVLFEEAQSNLRMVAEGLALRIDVLDQRMGAVEEALRDGLGDHERRLQALEGATG